MTGVLPTPVLELRGVDVAAGPAGDGSWPALMALDGAQVKWGRQQVLEQPAPATAGLALFDPSGTWAAGADLIGAEVALRWSWAGESRVYFRGRIATAAVRPKVVQRPDGTRVFGAVIELTAASVLTDLGNRRPPADPWPAETFAARRDRLAALVAGPVTALATRPTWDTAPLQLDEKPDGQTVLAHLDALWRNAGADRYSYDPHTRTLDWLARRTFPAADAARLARSATGGGVYVAGPAVQRSPADDPEPAASIPATSVLYDAGASRDMGSAITRVTLTYPGANSGGFTVLVDDADETTGGVRSLDVATAHTDDTRALAAAHDVAAMVAGEASGWVLDKPLRWETARTDGFDSIELARLLLAGYERSGVYWLAGSWLPDLDLWPLFGVMGGTIAYRDGGWRVEWLPAPVAVTGARPAGFSFDDLDPSVVWDDEDGPDTFHRSVTYADLGCVPTGTLTTI